MALPGFPFLSAVDGHWQVTSKPTGVPVKGEQRNRRKKEYQKEQIMVSCALCTRCNATVLIVVAVVVVVIVIVVYVDVDVAILCTCSLCKIKILLNHSLSDRVNY